MHHKPFALTLVAVGALLVSSLADAATITINLSPAGTKSNQTAPRDAESQFLSYLVPGYVTETFETFAVGTQESPLATSVGTFTQVVAGSGGACDGVLDGCDGGVAILDAGTSPFSGRFNTTAGGTKWLDSFDSFEFLFGPSAGATGVGFYVTDPNDAGGRFTISTASGATELDFGQVFGGANGNGRLYYLSFISSEEITGITILSNNRNDGFGVDDVTIGRVPEPGTLALLGLGLLGAGAMRRRS